MSVGKKCIATIERRSHTIIQARRSGGLFCARGRHVRLRRVRGFAPRFARRGASGGDISARKKLSALPLFMNGVSRPAPVLNGKINVFAERNPLNFSELLR